MDQISTKVKEALAVASFITAVVIVIFCLIVPPRGEIDSSALWAAAQFLVMCCSLLEIQAAIERIKPSPAPSRQGRGVARDANDNPNEQNEQ